MADGSTEVGSIIAYIKADNSDWLAKIEEAQAAKDRLKEGNPRITVEADTGEADEKLGAVETIVRELGAQSATVRVDVKSTSSGSGTDNIAAAEAKLAAAETASDLATQRAEIAQMKLNAVRDSGTGDAIKLASAELAYNSAVAQSDSAAARAIAAEDALTAARQAAAESAAEEAAATDSSTVALESNTAATTSSNDAMAGHNTLIGLAVVGIGALTGAALPLAGTLVAAGTAGYGMGASIAAAVYGADLAMKAGTQTGMEYSANLQTLKGDLDSIAGTAATDVLGGFEAVVKSVNSDMPMLNTQVENLSTNASTVGVEIVNGLVKGFQLANPLMNDAEQYAVELGKDFDQWITGGGLQQFLGMAQEDLPQVVATIKALAEGGLAVVQDLRPMGEVALEVAQGVGEVLQVIGELGPTLPVIAAGFGAGWLAMKAWSGATAIASGVQAGFAAIAVGAEEIDAAMTPVSEDFTQFMTFLSEAPGVYEAVAAGEADAAEGAEAMDVAMDANPIGLFVGGIAALIAILGVSAASTEDNTKVTTDYTTALSQAGSASTQAAAKMAAQNLQQANVVSTAKQYGLSLATLTSAVTGNSSAQDRMNSTLDAAASKYTKQVAAISQESGAYAASQSQAQKNLSAVQNLQKVVDNQTKSYSSSKSQLDQVTQASQRAAAADTARLSPVQQLTAAEDRLTTAQTNAQKAAQEYANFVAAQNDDALKLAQATSSLQGDYNNLGSTVKTNLQSMDKATATSLDVTTAAGLQNHNNILQAISDAESQASAVYQSQKEQGKSTQDATNVSNAALASAKTAIENQAAAAGMDKGQVDNLVNSLLSVPKDVKSSVSVGGTSAAESAIAAMEARLNSIPRQVTVQVSVQGSASATELAVTGSKTIAKAHGGSIGAFADGGGYVWGSAGSATSDSIDARLSVGEFVTTAQAASYPGVRTFLSAVNADPRTAMQAVGQQQADRELHLTFHDATTGGVMGLIKTTVSQVTAKQQQMARIANTAGRVR